MFSAPSSSSDELADQMTPSAVLRMRQWSNEALFVNLKLTLMILAGAIPQQAASASSAQYTVNTTANTVVFNLPSNAMDTSHLPSYMHLVSSNHLNRPNASNCITCEVKPVYFTNVSDVHMLWVESVKTYADGCADVHSNSFKKSLFCLQVNTIYPFI